MPRVRKPHSGSMQVWPRKRAKNIRTRVRSWPEMKETKLLGFAGYKAGMTHVFVLDNRPNSLTKGEEISLPVTIIECPPLKVAAVRLYVETHDGLKCASQANAEKLDKELNRLIILPKKALKQPKAENLADVRVLVYTQPKLTFIGKKKPELFELAIGGKNVEEKLKYAQSILGKEVGVKDVFSEGQLLDSHSVTKGKGVQGPVKRFGISLKRHKSEKSRRAPGSLGAWHGPRTWTVAHAGQMGYHQRVEYNKKLLAIEEDPVKVNPEGGFLRYGLVKNPYLIVHGSIGGAVKRLVRLIAPIRPAKTGPLAITQISIASKQ